MASYMIGPSEMDAEMFDAPSYEVAVREARRTFGAHRALICFGVYQHEPCI